MGRGGNENEATATGFRGVARTRGHAVAVSELAHVEEPLAVGEIVNFGKTGAIDIEPGMPANMVKGLAMVDQINRRPGDGAYMVRFNDDTQALVDLDGRRIAYSDQEPSPEHLTGALGAAMAYRAQMSDADDEATLHLGDMRAHFTDHPNSPEALLALAEAAQRNLDRLEGEISVNPADLQRTFPTQRTTVPTRRQIARARMKRLQQMIRGAMQIGVSDPAAALLYHAEEEGAHLGPTSEEIERRLASARRLGGEQLIPQQQLFWDEETGESVGDYQVGDQEATAFDLLKNHIAMGGRSTILRGPPGTGKGEFVRQVAAIRSQPLVTFNIGPRYDIEEALGATGLSVAELRDPESGEVKQIASISKQQVGALARALQEDCVVEIQEPDGLENELIRLNSALGDNIGEPGRRQVIVNSAEGEIALDVNPECLVFISYNSGEEDTRFRTATHDRSLNLDFDYADPESEAKHIAKTVTRALRNQTAAPELAAHEFTGEEMEPIVKAVNQLRQAHRDDPDNIRDVPGARGAAYFAGQVMLLSYAGLEDPVETAIKEWRWLMPGYPVMDTVDRDRHLRDLLADESGMTSEGLKGPLQDLAAWARSLNPDLPDPDEDDQDE